MSTPQTSPGRLRSQEQAQWAYDFVMRMTKNRSDKEKKELKSHLRKLPTHLQTSGLAQTLLFYAGKHPEIASVLCEKVTGKVQVAEGVGELTKMTAAQYRLKAREAMALAGWLKRYVEAIVKGD